MERKELLDMVLNHPKMKDGSCKVKVTVAKEK
jgi:hypothetical protein